MAMSNMLNQEGRTTRDYGNSDKGHVRRQIACKLFTGDMTYDQDSITDDGKIQGSRHFSEKWNFSNRERIQIELHPDSTLDDIIVKKAPANSKKIVGYIQGGPELSNRFNEYQAVNRLPTVDAAWGEYVPPVATVIFYGEMLDELSVVAENEAIAPYDYVKFVKDNKFAKSSNPTNLVSMVNVPALSSGKILVLNIDKFYGAD